MMKFFNVFIAYGPEWGPRLFRAMEITAEITISGFLLAAILGVLLALSLQSKAALLRNIGRTYVNFFRGVPLLVILFLTYFGLPGLGIALDAKPTAIISLGLCFGAQMAEVIRAGFLAIPVGQSEAAAAVGLTPAQIFASITIPQVVRIIAAPLVVTFVSLLKDSSLASLITVQELMLEGRALATEYFLPLQIFVCVGTLYFLIAFPLSLVARGLAKRAHSAR